MNRGWSYRDYIGLEHAGLTVLAYLTATRRHSTAAEWQSRIDRGEVELCGTRARGTDILHIDHTIVWHRPPWREPDVPTNFDIAYEDESLIVVNKPSGLPTLSGGGFLENTLHAMVCRTHPRACSLHRLGRFTSGLVVFAKTQKAASQLSRAWRDRNVLKIYRALGAGRAQDETLIIEAPIGPVAHPKIDGVYASCADGKPSHSVARVLERREDSTVFSVEITTGRPHQIRIHLAFAGHPLVGDPLYAAGGGLRDDPALPGDGGYWLHAEKLAFEHPLTKEPTTIVAEPPEILRTTASGLAP